MIMRLIVKARVVKEYLVFSWKSSWMSSKVRFFVFGRVSLEYSRMIEYDAVNLRKISSRLDNCLDFGSVKNFFRLDFLADFALDLL